MNIVETATSLTVSSVHVDVLVGIAVGLHQHRLRQRRWQRRHRAHAAAPCRTAAGRGAVPVAELAGDGRTVDHPIRQHSRTSAEETQTHTHSPRIRCIIRSQTIGRIGQRIARHVLELGTVTALRGRCGRCGRVRATAPRRLTDAASAVYAAAVQQCDEDGGHQTDGLHTRAYERAFYGRGNGAGRQHSTARQMMMMAHTHVRKSERAHRRRGRQIELERDRSHWDRALCLDGTVLAAPSVSFISTMHLWDAAMRLHDSIT